MTDPLSCLFHIMDGCRLSHFEGPVEKKKTADLSWKYSLLDRRMRTVIHNPESGVRRTKKGVGLGPVPRLIAAIRQGGPGRSVSTRGLCGKGKTGEPPGGATRKANKLSFSFQNSFLSQRSALATDEPPEGWAPPLINRLSDADLEGR